VKEMIMAYRAENSVLNLKDQKSS